MIADGWTLQGPARDVRLTRFCVFPKKKAGHYRKLTAVRLVSAILAVGGLVEFFPTSAECLATYLPAEWEYLLPAVAHYFTKVRDQVKKQGRPMVLVFPTPPRLEVIERHTARSIKVCPKCHRFTLARLANGWSCDVCNPREGTRPLAPTPPPPAWRVKRNQERMLEDALRREAIERARMGEGDE